MASKSKGKGRAKGTGAIVKISNRFYLRRVVDGRRVSVLLRHEDGKPCTAREDAIASAERLLTSTNVLELKTQTQVVKKLAEIKQAENIALARMPDVWEAFCKSANRPECNETQTAAQRREFLKFSEWLKGKGIVSPAEITPALANAYMAELGEGVSNRCFNMYLGFLRLVFSLGKDAAGLAVNPFEGIKRRKEQTISRKDFTPEQVKAIFDYFHSGCTGTGQTSKREWKPMFSDEMETLLKICCFTGADGQSGCLMKWDGVNMANGTISYIREKTKRATGGKVITLPIHPVLMAALEKAQAWREPENPYIMPNVARRYQKSRACLQKDVQRVIHIALGVEVTNYDTQSKRKYAACVYSLHSFRHTFVSFCSNAGISLDIVAEIVGHGNPVMTRHYSHIHEEAKQKAIAAIPSLDDMKDITPTPEALAREELKRLADSLELADVQAILKKYSGKA